jgi:hypothetical protein
MDNSNPFITGLLKTAGVSQYPSQSEQGNAQPQPIPRYQEAYTGLKNFIGKQWEKFNLSNAKPLPNYDLFGAPSDETPEEAENREMLNTKRLKILKKYMKLIRSTNDPLIKMEYRHQMEQSMREAFGEDISPRSILDKKMGGLNMFLQGATSLKPEEMLNPGYRSFEIDDDPEYIKRARKYNRELSRMSARYDKPVAAVSKGLGAFTAAALGGTPAGLLLGKGIASGIPFVADWWKNRKAQQYEDRDADRRRYNPRNL